MSNSIVQTNFQNINNLPDDVLQHLLTFLPTKEAIATSILSKQWRYLWRWVPVLDLQDTPSCNEKQRKNFKRLVDGALLLNMVASLAKFRLSCDITYGPSSLNTWINTVLRRFVEEEVDISIFAAQQSLFLELPHRFFTITNLKVLKLSNQILIDIRNSTSVCFPSLKILHLQFVEFASGECISRLLQGCKVLEELLISRFFNDNVKNIVISVPTLKILDIHQQLGEANWTELTSQGYQLKVNAPNLEYLNILDLGSLVRFESIFINLIKANISFTGTGLFQLAEALCNAKFLSLRWIYCHGSIASLNDGTLPLFPNLIQLQLGIGFDDWKIISHFLLRSTYHLKALIIYKIRVINEPWRVPKGLSPYLTNVYSGDDIEIEVVEYTLEGLGAWQLLWKFFMPRKKKHSPKFPRPYNKRCKLAFK